MVAKIITGKSMKGAINYNEKKVTEGKAELLYAYRFPSENLSFEAKLRRFQLLTEQNRRSKTNTVHISLNFDPSEKLSKEVLLGVANTYMQGIGFESQPYLLYQHFDAAHPHVHIVTTNIKDGGKAIPLHNIGEKQSETTRKEIETTYGLIQAKSQQRKPNAALKPIEEGVNYGKSETKAAISNVVRNVVKDYRFTSFTEFNAVLNHFNVSAYRGEEGTRMREKKGLTYSVLDAKGDKKSIPIKASAIYTRPTLPSVEKKFADNIEKRKPFVQRLKNIITDTLDNNALKDKEAFAAHLKEKNITVLFNENEKLVYGITFIDHDAKTIFKGSTLGKDFSAITIMQRIGKAGQQSRQERSENRKAAEKAIKDTIFSKGMAGALTELYSKGFRITAERNDFYIGHYSTQDTNYVPISERLSAYFQVNGLTEIICNCLNSRSADILQNGNIPKDTFPIALENYLNNLLGSEQAITNSTQNLSDKKRKRRKPNW